MPVVSQLYFALAALVVFGVVGMFVWASVCMWRTRRMEPLSFVDEEITSEPLPQSDSRPGVYAWSYVKLSDLTLEQLLDQTIEPCRWLRRIEHEACRRFGVVPAHGNDVQYDSPLYDQICNAVYNGQEWSELMRAYNEIETSEQREASEQQMRSLA